MFYKSMKFICTSSAMLLLSRPTCACCVASLSLIYSLPLPHGTVKCPSDLHFIISLKIIGHPATFHLLFFKNDEFGHTTCLAHIFFDNVKYLISDAASIFIMFIH